MARIAWCVLIAGVAAAPCLAQDTMPGMDMGQGKQTSTQGQPKEPARAHAAAHSHEAQEAGAKGSGAGSPSKPTVPAQPRGATPAHTDGLDMGGMTMHSGDVRPAGEAQQGAGSKTMSGTGSDMMSVTEPFQSLQEPEAIGFQTGQSLPAPELLKDVVRQTPRTLESFLAAAESGNPTLRQAEENVVRSGEQARQAGLPPDPIVGYSAEHIRGGSYHGGEEGAFFEQEFVLGRKLALRRDVYRAEGRANELQMEVQRARVRNDVAQAFWNALAAQETAVVRDRLLKVALDTEENAHELERVGQADASDVLSAEVAAEQAKMDFVEAQRNFLAQYAQLSAYAGESGGAVHPLRGELVSPPAMDAEAEVTKDVQESPAVKEAQGEVATAEARVRAAKREAVPNLRVTAGEWYSGETLGTTNIQAGWMSFAQAGVQLPLWNRNQGNVAAAEAELVRSRHAVTRTQLWTRKETEPYAQEYGAARFRVERYRSEMLPRARRAYELEVTKYQEMAQSYPHVLRAQGMLFALQMGYVEALRTEWTSAIALENSALTRALEQPASVGEDGSVGNTPTGGGR